MVSTTLWNSQPGDNWKDSPLCQRRRCLQCNIPQLSSTTWTRPTERPSWNHTTQSREANTHHRWHRRFFQASWSPKRTSQVLKIFVERRLQQTTEGIWISPKTHIWCQRFTRLRHLRFTTSSQRQRAELSRYSRNRDNRLLHGRFCEIRWINRRSTTTTSTSKFWKPLLHPYQVVQQFPNFLQWTGWKLFKERESLNLHKEQQTKSTGSFLVPTHRHVCCSFQQTQHKHPPEMNSTQTARTHFTTFWATGNNSTGHNCHEDKVTTDMAKRTTLGRRTTRRPSTIPQGLDH